MKIANSVVFVTGASRGLGLAFAREALARGAAKVYAGVRNPAGFNEPGIVPIALDVTDAASVEAAAKAAPDVTVLVNNAGIAEVTGSPLAHEAEAHARRVFETNYYGVMRVTRAFEPALPGDGRGGIVNVLSDVTWRTVPMLAPYAASKAAAWSFTNTLRAQLKTRNIGVVGLHVGFVDTDLTKDFDVPKASPVDVVRQAFDALEANESEVLADEGSRTLKATLSLPVPAYIDPAVLEGK
ncbi:SDR family oxidoreductase [Paraburkholderia sp. Ac-20340]|uniref:SDR family oxidoreductase n=1 Tax=Paraburkholderia sp. Ac-20340 TaxID=2703888 RepID=UPI00197EFEC3|nr:SDR family oxidoreductase [Paraburkholderia sp. Ac-20340]MBN3852301.1 SDR family oxidoreductase [Paraburkholderia sp. Ac-20340]